MTHALYSPTAGLGRKSPVSVELEMEIVLNNSNGKPRRRSFLGSGRRMQPILNSATASSKRRPWRRNSMTEQSSHSADGAKEPQEDSKRSTSTIQSSMSRRRGSLGHSTHNSTSSHQRRRADMASSMEVGASTTTTPSPRPKRRTSIGNPPSSHSNLSSTTIGRDCSALEGGTSAVPTTSARPKRRTSIGNASSSHSHGNSVSGGHDSVATEGEASSTPIPSTRPRRRTSIDNLSSSHSNATSSGRELSTLTHGTRSRRRASLGDNVGSTYVMAATASTHESRNGYDTAQQMEWRFTTTADDDGTLPATMNLRQLHRRELSSRAISTRNLQAAAQAMAHGGNAAPPIMRSTRNRPQRRASVGHAPTMTTQSYRTRPKSQSQRSQRSISILLEHLDNEQDKLKLAQQVEETKAPQASQVNTSTAALDTERPTHFLKKDLSAKSHLSAFSSTGWTVASNSSDSAFSSTGWSVDGNESQHQNPFALHPNRQASIRKLSIATTAPRRGGRRPGRDGSRNNASLTSLPSLLD